MLQQKDRLWQHTKFHPNQLRNLQEKNIKWFAWGLLLCFCVCVCVCACVCEHACMCVCTYVCVYLLLSHITVTLDEGQSHSNWYQNVDVNDLYHQTKSEKSQFVLVDVQTQANIDLGGRGWKHQSRLLSLDYWLDQMKRLIRQDENSITFHNSTSLNSMPNSVQVN